MGKDGFQLKQSVLLGFVFAALSVAFLFAIFPHSSGYYDRDSLFKRVNNFWHYRGGTWAHGMFVVPILVVLLYIRRKDFEGLALRPSNYGALIICFALFIYWVGYKANMHYFGFAAIHLLIVGLVLFLLGWEWFKKLFFYLAFLTFMWPFVFLDEQIAVPLRYLMVTLSSATLSLLGIDNLKVGTAIVSAADASKELAQGQRFQLDVANPCSGIRSLFALMMVSALYGYTVVKGFWKNVFFFLCSIPFAVLGNLARIMMLTFGSLWFGSEIAVGVDGNESTFHIASGFLVFVVALMGMVFLSTLLNHGFSWIFGKRVSIVKRKVEVKN